MIARLSRRGIASAQTTNGFTLVEILVATTVLLVVGGAAGLLLTRAFTLWEHGVAQTRTLAATEAFATGIGRDFASLQGGMGFIGDSVACRFWSLEVEGTAPPRLVMIDYEIQPSAIIRRSMAHGDTATREWRFAPVTAPTLCYGDREAPSAEWLDTWSSPTNAPVRLGLRFQNRAGVATVLPFLRRTP